MDWKLENNIFYYLNNDSWSQVKAEDIYWAAFGGEKNNQSNLPEEIADIRTAFPDIKFSKFSVSPELKIEVDEKRILIKAFFTKAQTVYEIPLPTNDGVDYGFADKTWCYYSGDYYRIADVLEKADISTEEINFYKYVNLLNALVSYPGIAVHDYVNGVWGRDQSEGTDIDFQPEGLQATLYPYQSIGFRWLKYVTDDECGCVLGDEMGLGKTLQVISLFVERKSKKTAPQLVVAPLSLLENWKREINRFAPELDVLIHHGTGRTGRYKDLLPYDVVITSYGATISDLSLFEMIDWDLLVLDEAQNIKNPNAMRTASVKQIPHRAAIAVTGTPFENHLTDIWSILDFAIPGCLGSLSSFQSEYADDVYGAEKIEPILTALMIRRKVADVAKDLPEKIVISQPLRMDAAEALRYEDTRQEILRTFDGKTATLAALTKLRMFCTHPGLVDENILSSDPTKTSLKYNRFCEIVEEIFEREEKVIVFTSYTDMFELMKEDIEYRFPAKVDCINGSTPAAKRQEIVDWFTNFDGAAMLVLNPKAAGAGLNITAANHVIHYNLEWNPALEDQATARAFRRGQDKTVFVYRLFYLDTVEEIVNDKINNKRIMSETAVVGSEGTEDTHALIINALGMSPLKEDS